MQVQDDSRMDGWKVFRFSNSKLAFFIYDSDNFILEIISCFLQIDVGKQVKRTRELADFSHISEAASVFFDYSLIAAWYFVKFT